MSNGGNDELHHVIEAGHVARDDQNGGLIDGACALLGANGLFVGLETFVDCDDSIDCPCGERQAPKLTKG